MIVFRRRLIYWLIKEYVKKSKKTLLLFFIVGLIGFFSLRFLIGLLGPKIPIGQKEIIGLVGVYEIENLPQSLLSEVSTGLTRVAEDGTILPGVARSWKIEENGKAYIFFLRKDVYFTDGTPLTSSWINYNFSDVVIERPDKYTIAFKLKETYAPFLITVSQPIFKKNYIGVGEYEIKNIKLNGNLVKSLTLVSIKNRFKKKTYQFYSSSEALKMAHVLGEINRAERALDIAFENTTFAQFPNLNIKKTTNYEKLVTLFYNLNDSVLSDKKVRNALSYSISDEFAYGERAHAPISPKSWAYNHSLSQSQDLDRARLLFASSDTTSTASLTLKINTLPRYKKIAENLSQDWEKIGIKTKIEIVQNVPSVFQIFLGDYNVSKDPDQYALWHSSQPNNITNYKNLRIDKLLEDGRKTNDVNERKKIYIDFQKYLMDDAPATFLYFPYEYEITRK